MVSVVVVGTMLAAALGGSFPCASLGGFAAAAFDMAAFMGEVSGDFDMTEPGR
jgi:hypothetical protein